MSVMRCKQCEHHIDTDYDDTGVFDDGPPYGFTCGHCVEREEMEAAEERE